MDARGQKRVFLGVKPQMVTHVNEPSGNVGSHATRKGNGLRDSLVSGMWLVAQGIDHKKTDALQELKSLGRHLSHIGNISERAQPIPQDGQTAMKHGNGGDRDTAHVPLLPGLDDMGGELGNARITVLHQTIRQALAQMGDGIVVTIKRQVVKIAERTQVVYASHMIIMFMSDEYGIKPFVIADTKHLLAKVGAAIDEDAGVSLLHKGGTTQAFVTRILALTHGAMTSYLRDAATGAGAKKRNAHDMISGSWKQKEATRN